MKQKVPASGKYPKIVFASALASASGVIDPPLQFAFDIPARAKD